jgi:SAM-dependent methyltransferase
MNTCRICGYREPNSVHTVREMMFGYRDTFDYFECSDCGCVQISTFPTDIARYYPAAYYSYQPMKREGRVRGYLLRHRNRSAVFGEGIFGRIMLAKRPAPDLRSLRYTDPIISTSILDVGCGSGRLLIRLRELGLTNLLGIDPFAPADIEYPNGVAVRRAEIDGIGGEWDVIMFHHSFEHIQDPCTTLRTVYSHLRTGGYCIVRIPTVSSFAWREYGTDWVQLDAPRHFHLHSSRSMGIAANTAGLALERIVYDSDSFQFWGSEQIRRGIAVLEDRSYGTNRKGSLFSSGDIATFSKRAKRLNAVGQGDQAVFVLRKVAGHDSRQGSEHGT